MSQPPAARAKPVTVTMFNMQQMHATLVVAPSRAVASLSRPERASNGRAALGLCVRQK